VLGGWEFSGAGGGTVEGMGRSCAPVSVGSPFSPLRLRYKIQRMHERFCGRLAREFSNRKRTNASFSLRAFARFLGVDHSTLSQMIRGDRRVSAAQIQTWGKKLGLASEEIRAYVAGEGLPDAAASFRENRLRQWSAEATTLMTSSAHWRLLQLARRPEFRADSRWIGGQIGLSADEVNVAFTRLLRLGLMQTTAGGQWTLAKDVQFEDERVFMQMALGRIREYAAME
jgi:transcriptional regulator with XRE-family HTH domain